MSFFGSLVSIVSPKAGRAIDKAWEGIKDAVNDVVDWVDEKIVQPILDDPLRFIVVATAYAYGIPGLEFAGPMTAAATGIASGAYSLAKGKSVKESLEDGLVTYAFTGAGNYVKNEFFAGTPTTPDGITPDATDSITFDGTDSITFDGVDAGVDASVDVGSGGIDTSAVPSSAPPTTSPLDPASLDPASSTRIPSSSYTGGYSTQVPTDAPQLFTNAPLPSELNLDITPPAPPSTDLPADHASSYTRNAAGQSSQGSVYRPENYVGGPERAFVPHEANMPATPDTYGPDPNYPDNPNIRVKLEDGQPRLPEVVDYSKAAGPLEGGTPTIGQVWDYTKALGENALSYTLQNPYTVGGGLLLADQLFNEGKVTDKIGNVISDIVGGGGPPPGGNNQPPGAGQQIGDPSFYENLKLLNMSRDYDPYKDDIYKYGQASGEHKFLSDPVYTPVSYADGGFVDPMQRPYQSPAVGPMMAPQQMQTQQPMGALSQVNAMTNKPSPMGPSRGAPPRMPQQMAQQMPGRGALQQVSPRQQNPDYRYFSYGQIPASIGLPMQQPQGRATGGLAMARGGNVADGRTDNIHAMLSPGEYVMDAETVALLGNGNNDAGAKRLDHMREAVRKQKGGALSKGKISPDAQSPLAYLNRRMA